MIFSDITVIVAIEILTEKKILLRKSYCLGGIFGHVKERRQSVRRELLCRLSKVTGPATSLSRVSPLVINTVSAQFYFRSYCYNWFPESHQRALIFICPHIEEFMSRRM